MKEFRSFTREITPNDLHSLFLTSTVHFLFSSNFLCFPSASFVWREANTWLGTRSIDFPRPQRDRFSQRRKKLYTVSRRRWSRAAETCAMRVPAGYYFLSPVAPNRSPTSTNRPTSHRGLSSARCQWPRISANLSTDSMSLYNRCCSNVCDQWPTANRWITDDANHTYCSWKLGDLV